MIYHPYAAKYKFEASWGTDPEHPITIYSTFFNRPPQDGKYIFIVLYPDLAGLVAVAGVWPCLPIEYTFQNTRWYNRSPVPRPAPYPSGDGDFWFGNAAYYSVTVDFLADGGSEFWQIASQGGEAKYPKEPKCIVPPYQGERKLTNLWLEADELEIPDIGYPQLLNRSIYSHHSDQRLADFPTLTAYLEYDEELSKLTLYQYPDIHIPQEKPLSQLISCEVVLSGERTDYFGYSGPKMEPQLLGHGSGETVLFNFAYRCLDFFGPYALAIPKGEGVWTITLKKTIKDARHIRYQHPTAKLKWTYNIVSLPIWDYSIRWYIRNTLVRETKFPKETETSFIYFLAPCLDPSNLAIYVWEYDYGHPYFHRWEVTTIPDLKSYFFFPSGRKLMYTAGKEPSWLYPELWWFFAPRRDFDPAGRPQRHRRFPQCYSTIPPFPSAPIGLPSLYGVYNWHPTGNFIYIGWDDQGFFSYSERGFPIPDGSYLFPLPPSDILNQKLGRPFIDAILLTLLSRPEMEETIIFWWKPRDLRFFLILQAFYKHFQAIGWEIGDPYIPWEFWLSPQDPRPFTWGYLKMLVWRRYQGIVAERDLGCFPIQFIFPAIEKSTGYIYLPLMVNMNDDGSGQFKLFVFKKNDWSPEEYPLT